MTSKVYMPNTGNASYHCTVIKKNHPKRFRVASKCVLKIRLKKNALGGTFKTNNNPKHS